MYYSEVLFDFFCSCSYNKGDMLFSSYESKLPQASPETDF